MKKYRIFVAMFSMFLLIVGCSNSTEMSEQSAIDQSQSKLNTNEDQFDSEQNSEEIEPSTTQEYNEIDTIEDNEISIEEVQSLVYQAFSHLRHVKNGGNATFETFTYNNNTYRYLSDDINSPKKLKDYLEEVFVTDIVEDFLNRTELIVYDERLAQPDVEGGTLLNWYKAEAILLIDKTSYKEYEFTVPEGDGFSTKKIRIEYQEGKGWLVATPTYEFE